MVERADAGMAGRTEPLFLSDAEIARRVSMTAEEWKAAATVLEREGLPRRDPLFRDQRCWPSVRDFLYRRSSGGVELHKPRVVEDLDALRSTGRRRARP